MNKWLKWLFLVSIALVFLASSAFIKDLVKAEVTDDYRYYTIRTKSSAVHYMYTPDAKSNLILSNATKKTSAKFLLQKQPDGAYIIGTGVTAGVKVLTNTIQAKNTNANNQKWILSKITGNGNSAEYQIINKATGKALTYHLPVVNGATISETAKNASDTQKFIINPYNETYTVTFKDDTKIIKRQSVKKGMAATAPVNPTKTGYAFKGWDTALTNVNKNFTAKPEWAAKTVKTIFNYNAPDGSNKTKQETYTFGKTNQSFGMNVKFNDWQINGYKLVGWSPDKGAVEKTWIPYNRVTDGWINANHGTYNLYAVWDAELGHHESAAKNGTTIWWYKTNKAPELVKNVEKNSDPTKKALTTTVVKNKKDIKLAINGGTWYMSGKHNTYPRGLFAIGSTIYHSCQNASNEEVLALTKDGKLVSENLGSEQITINNSQVRNRTVTINKYDSLKYEWAVKGNYVIMENGEMADWSLNNQHTENNPSNAQRQPESFICQDTDGYYYLATTGGRNNEGVGVTYKEIHEFALTQMSKKINFIYVLDGGGSATYVLDGILKNNPTSIVNNKYEITERAIPNCLVIK